MYLIIISRAVARADWILLLLHSIIICWMLRLLLLQNGHNATVDWPLGLPWYLITLFVSGIVIGMIDVGT